MSNKNLQMEAKFQDEKINGTSKRTEGRFYVGLSLKKRVSFVNALLGDIEKKKVLDLGAGDGFNTISMLERGAQVYAIDISPESISHINKIAKKYSNYKGFVMDASAMEFSDNTFDIVVGYGVLHHLLDYENTIPEILRVLKVNGKAIFVEPLGMNPVINLYRKCTPNSRTLNERPLNYHDLKVIKNINPKTKYYFSDLFTLVSKCFIFLGCERLAYLVEKIMINIDNVVLRPKDDNITFFQRMSWITIIHIEK